MTGKLFASGTAAIVYVFAGDFFPTLLRNQSYGASNLPARIVAMCAPFLLYLGKNKVMITVFHFFFSSQLSFRW